jgi:pimeloyl-ACP methyl ester carboxylesterase
MVHCGTPLATIVPVSGEIDVYHLPATDLHIETRGSGEPTLFFHGTGGDTTSWTQQLPLAAAYELILVNRRGYGESPRAPLGTTSPRNLRNSPPWSRLRSTSSANPTAACWPCSSPLAGPS